MKIFFFFLLFFAHVAFASNCEHTSNQFSCVTFIDNYDGDTVTFKIPNVHQYFGAKAKVRIKGIDTPELKPKGVPNLVK